MIPELVRFTGLTVSSASLLYGYDGRKYDGIPPPSWARVEFDNNHMVSREMDRVDSWIAKTIAGRWASRQIRNGNRFVVSFEDDSDALLFKLMNGETAWLEEQSSN